MTEKVPLIARGQPITAEYLNSLARAINAGQIVLPASATGGAAISSPAGSGSSPVSDNRDWTITSVTTVGGIADTLTMTDGLGSIWTVSNLGDLCAVCGGGGGGGATNYVMAVTLSQESWWVMTVISNTSCPAPNGSQSYATYELRCNFRRRNVTICQNGSHLDVNDGNYVKLLNAGSPLANWNFSTATPADIIYTWPSIPSIDPDPATCTLATYVTMTNVWFSASESVSTATCVLSAFPDVPTCDQLQILSSDNTTVIFDLDLSGAACEDRETITITSGFTESLTWTPCAQYYFANTSPCVCLPSSNVIGSATRAGGAVYKRWNRKSWILAAPA